MKVTQKFTPEDFEKITKVELHRLWFNEALTDKKVAILYGVTKQDVKEKRRQFKLTMITAAMLKVTNSKYK